MKKTILLFTFIFIAQFVLLSQNHEERKYSFLLTGASFATSNNGWFEIGCELTNAKALNRAVSAEAIAHTANRMIDGTLYNMEELDNIDALVIMHVHDRDVFDPSQLKEKYTEYKTPFDYSNYAAAYDYVIKRFLTECYNLKFNEKSKFYNTPAGKPAVIVLCTHWHDARTTYNATIRQLAQKWGFPVVEFDKYIGFSKNAVHPVTNEQISRLYTSDTQETNGVVYGWHPKNGTDAYIQNRMGAIFADTMRKIFPVK